MFSSSTSQILNLAENVTGGSASMFTYYADSSSGSLLNASALGVPLTTSAAPTVAEVDLDLRFAPRGGDRTSQTYQTTELRDSAVFDLTAHTAGSQNVPCQ